MFTDEILEEIFSDDRISHIPIIFQSLMLKVVEEVLERHKYDN